MLSVNDHNNDEWRWRWEVIGTWYLFLVVVLGTVGWYWVLGLVLGTRTFTLYCSRSPYPVALRSSPYPTRALTTLHRWAEDTLYEVDCTHRSRLVLVCPLPLPVTVLRTHHCTHCTLQAGSLKLKASPPPLPPPSDQPSSPFNTSRAWAHESAAHKLNHGHSHGLLRAAATSPAAACEWLWRQRSGVEQCRSPRTKPECRCEFSAQQPDPRAPEL